MSNDMKFQQITGALTVLMLCSSSVSVVMYLSRRVLQIVRGGLFWLPAKNSMTTFIDVRLQQR